MSYARFFLLVVLVPALCSAQVSHTANSSRDYQWLWVTDTGPRGDYVMAWADSCETISFTPTTRPYEASPGQPGRTEELFSFPYCRWAPNFAGPYGVLLGRITSGSIRDLGTYTVRCTNAAVATVACRSISEPNACGRRELCLPVVYNSVGSYETTVEITNTPPRLSVSHTGTNLLPGGDAAYNSRITLSVEATDPDGGTPDLFWEIREYPPTASPRLLGASRRSPEIQFSNENDFGTWIFEAIADDAQGERVRQRYTINVVNQPPRPAISGASRVPFGTDIVLDVSPDEDGGDYTFVRWEAFAPGSVGWTVVGGSTPRLTVPTDVSAVGEWRFRVQVTDNEVPPLTGTSEPYVVEVYNQPPQLTLDPVAARVQEGDGRIEISASAVDPDGGDVLLSVRAFQVPDTSSTAVGAVLATSHNSIRYVHTARSGDAGTWIFEVVATDDEPAPWQETDTAEAIVVVDGLPTAEIDGPDRVGSLTGMLALSSVDADPDSPCEGEPRRCHRTADGSPVRAISPGIVRRVWTLVDATLDDGDYFPTGNVRDVFDVRAEGAMIEVPPEKLRPGLFTFQVAVEDGEANIGEAFHQVEVIEENTKPLAIVSPPARHIVSVFGGAPADIAVSGAYSFDPDNILTGDLPGIEAYDWSLIYGPEGCVTPENAPVYSLYGAGERVPAECQSVYAVKLTVTDDDRPTGRTASAETAVSIGTCPGTVCIDLPTNALPRMVEFADDTDVLILYHVDPSAAAAFPYGMSARLDIFHESDPLTPVFTSYSPNVRTTALTPLLVFHWNGYWFAERPRPGRYSVQISLVDYTLAPTGPAFQTRENNAILIEVDELIVATDADRYVARAALEDGSDTVSIGYDIDGPITPERIEWRLVDAAGAIVFRGTLPPRLSGVLDWDGRVSPRDVVAPGHYTVELEAFRGTASLTGVARHPLTVYDLRLQPIAGPGELILLVNNDDDNLNGIADGTEAGAVAGENDLLGVNLLLDPPIEGLLTLTTTDASPRLKLYARADRAGGDSALPLNYNLPAESLPSAIYLEGTTGGAANLRLQLQPSDAGALPDVDATVRVVELAVEDQAFARMAALGIATWEHAYQATVPFAVRNARTDNFVDREPRRFHVRVNDAAANADPARAESAVAEIATVLDGGAPDDDPTRITLFERDAMGGQAPDSGSFQSNAQILVTPDLPANPDDDFRAHDGIGNLRNDDAPDDRTHRATIDGAVKITYRPAGGPPLDYTVPVCARSPEARRTVEIRAWIFTDPTTGAPSATPAFVQAHVDRANIAWAHACLKFRLSGAPSVVSAPTVASPMGPVDILADGTFGGAADRDALFSAYAGGAQLDRFELFIVPNLAGANAVTYGPFDNLAALGLNTFIVMAASTTGTRTLAHELGHALGNTADQHRFTYVFYPSRDWQAGDPLPAYPRTVDDTDISAYRRVFDPDLTDARTDRALAHATPGDTSSPAPPPNARGNYALKMP